MKLDAVIFGGGVAGLWTLDELVRNGRSAVLLEAGDLGSGQTVASQGILHGGLKYTLSGLFTKSAEHIRDMPRLWAECLDGEREPCLSDTTIRAEFCHLWRTDSLLSKLGMVGAGVQLRVKPTNLDPTERPPVLASCPGTVARLDEQVIAPASFVQNLLDRHRSRILKIDRTHGLDFRTVNGRVETIALTDADGTQLDVEPANVVFAAGAGNAKLRTAIGLANPAMQRRPLHMVMIRGDLPTLNGHCVDGAKTRVTITTDTDTDGRTVWQVGGQIAEAGVEFDERTLLERARAEVADCIPGLDLTGTEWSTYVVDRAEAITRGNKRPETFQVLEDGNVLTVWPTKLVLAPQLAADITRRIPCETLPNESEPPSSWTRPEVARPPWETATNWHDLDATAHTHRRVA